jgi:hypothetical protein
VNTIVCSTLVVTPGLSDVCGVTCKLSSGNVCAVSGRNEIFLKRRWRSLPIFTATTLAVLNVENETSASPLLRDLSVRSICRSLSSSNRFARNRLAFSHPRFLARITRKITPPA